MKNIDKVNPFKAKVQNTDSGTLTTLIAEIEVSAKDSISFDGKTLMTNYVYKENQTYDLVYTVVEINGNTESFSCF